MLDQEEHPLVFRDYPNEPHRVRNLQYIKTLAASMAPPIGESSYYHLFQDNNGNLFLVNESSGSAGIGVFVHELKEPLPPDADMAWCSKYAIHAEETEILVGPYGSIPFGFTEAWFHEFNCVVRYKTWRKNRDYTETT